MKLHSQSEAISPEEKEATTLSIDQPQSTLCADLHLIRRGWLAHHAPVRLHHLHGPLA